MITVVIASYRYGHLAAHCIESVLCQTKKADRILFVDDGVGDCNHLPKLYPSIEYVMRENNLGTVANFQDMLNRVETDRCLFLGADNWLRADTLELLDKNNTDIVTYDIVITGELSHKFSHYHKNEITPYQGDFYWSRKMVHHGSMLYNTNLAKKVGGYAINPGGVNSEEDWVLWNRMISAKASISHVNEGLLYYRRHKENFIKF
jgi:glycosyltransferase involved in cell wall biosynthesis